MKQVVLKGENVQGNQGRIDGQTFLHLTKVRRVKEGQTLSILVPGQGQTQGRICEIMDTYLTLELLDELKERILSPFSITLILGWLKGNKLDEVIRRLTELGADQILIVSLDFSLGLPGKNLDHKIQRWKTIIREATEQSGRSSLAEIQVVDQKEELPSLLKGFDQILYFHPQPLEQVSLHGYLSAYCFKVALVLGPEGGFSPMELDLFSSWGWKAAFLPTPILRAETAALAAMAITKTLLEEQSHWKTPDFPSLKG